MSIIFNTLLPNIILGIFAVILLVFSAEFLVEKLIGMGKYYGVSNSFIGLTVLSFGTSLPEMAAHVVASLGILLGSLDYNIASATVLGANIGSDVIQQTLILGLIILIVGSITFPKDFLKKSYSVMIGTTLLTLILSWDRVISRVDGLILFSTFILYMWFLYRNENKTKIKKRKHCKFIFKDIFIIIGGLSVLVISSIYVLKVTEFVVIETGLGGSLIGVISLGVVSAFPEFFTAISGIRKKAMGISLGTLIGSNITNPLVAIGLGGIISTYSVPKPLIYWDLPMETITATLLLCYLLFTNRKLGRWGAFYLIGLYLFYLIVRLIYFPIDF
jgi:cation:H+ antiporter